MKQLFDQADSKSIEAFAKKLEGNSLLTSITKRGLGVPTKVNDKNKGNFGLVLEEYYFGVKNNNIAAPDFPDAGDNGVELKATPIKLLKRNEFVAKERLVLGNIDYTTVAEETFELSKFFHKADMLLLIFYVYQKDKSFFEYIIDLATLWKIPEQDLRVIIEDWHKIVGVVKERKAHELTSGATKYLEACRGGGKLSKPQKYSIDGIEAPPAKLRRFALKSSYMTGVYQSLKARKDTSLVSQKIEESLESIITSKFAPYVGMKASEISVKFRKPYNLAYKSRFDALSHAILGVKTRGKIVEFEKSGTILKTVRMLKRGVLAESVSFPAFVFAEVIKEKWEPDDELEESLSGYKDILQSPFVFVIYDCEKSETDPVLKGVKFWTMPAGDLEGSVWRMWEETIEAIKNSNPKKFPGQADNPVAHVRPHGSNKKDVDILPNGKKFTKQAFWLNAKYLGHILSK